MRGSIRRRCTTCAVYAEEETGLCPRDPDHNVKWSAIVDVSPPGAPRRQRRKTFDRKKDAAEWVSQMSVDAASGSLVDPTRLTFGEYVRETWLPWIEASGLRQSTIAFYRDALKHVKTLEPIPLQQITARMLSELYAELRESGGRRGQGLAPRTVRHVATLVGKIFKDAGREDPPLVRHNPARAAKVPSASSTKSRAAEHEAWSGAQVAEFFDHVGDDRLRPLWLFLARTGVRRAEALGLHWDRVDLDAGTGTGTVSITRTRSSVNHEIVEEDKTKTARSRRRISLDGDTVAVLREWKDRQKFERRAYGPSWSDTGHVFTREDGEPWHPDYISRLFDQAVRESGLPRIPLKGLRHTSATVGLEAGVPAKVVQERLGHSSISITMDTYSHVTEGMDREAAERIAKMMGGNA